MAEKTITAEDLEKMRYVIPEDIKSYFEEGERTLLASSKKAAEDYFNEIREELSQKNDADSAGEKMSNEKEVEKSKK